MDRLKSPQRRRLSPGWAGGLPPSRPGWGRTKVVPRAGHELRQAEQPGGRSRTSAPRQLSQLPQCVRQLSAPPRNSMRSAAVVAPDTDINQLRGSFGRSANGFSAGASARCFGPRPAAPFPKLIRGQGGFRVASSNSPATHRPAAVSFPTTQAATRPDRPAEGRVRRVPGGLTSFRLVPPHFWLAARHVIQLLSLTSLPCCREDPRPGPTEVVIQPSADASGPRTYARFAHARNSSPRSPAPHLAKALPACSSDQKPSPRPTIVREGCAGPTSSRPSTLAARLCPPRWPSPARSDQSETSTQASRRHLPVLVGYEAVS